MFKIFKWILAVIVAILLIVAIGNIIEDGYFERAADFIVSKFNFKNGYFWDK